MAEYKSYINALKQCAKEHENEIVSFAHIRTTDLCNDTADLLEKLEKESDNAIPIPEGATNGDIIKAMFPNQTIGCAIPITDRNGAKFYRTTINGVTDFTESWWNAPYRKVEE